MLPAKKTAASNLWSVCCSNKRLRRQLKPVGVFRRIFEKCIGQKPLDYLNKLRIDYAKELLQSGFYNIESVAAMCGFRDPKYFSTVFKRVRGISPSEYKKKFS